MKKPELQGNSLFNPSNPKIIQYKNEFSEEMCLHELLHAKLWFSGFADARVKNPNQQAANAPFQISNILNGVFQHAIIFPELCILGFSPKESENSGAKMLLDSMQSPGFLSSSSGGFSIALTAVVYVRANLETTLQNVDASFQKHELEQGKWIGIQIENLVRKQAIQDKSEFKKGLLKAIDLLQMGEFFEINESNAA